MVPVELNPEPTSRRTNKELSHEARYRPDVTFFMPGSILFVISLSFNAVETFHDK